MKRVTFLITLFFILLMACKAIALYSKTHSEINGRAVQLPANGFFLNSYLANNLNLKDGNGTIFNGENVLQWIKDGGEYEDTRPVPVLSERSFSIFIDPTQHG